MKISSNYHNQKYVWYLVESLCIAFFQSTTKIEINSCKNEALKTINIVRTEQHNFVAYNEGITEPFFALVNFLDT